MVVTSLKDIAAAVRPTVVGVGQGARGGTGFVIAPGRVLTADHHVRDDAVLVRFADGRTAQGRRLARDRAHGIAVLDVDTGDAPALAWDDGAALRLGDPVIAAADPAGSGLRVTGGVVASEPHALARRGVRAIEGVIEHTAPLPRGAAGGPLLTADGKLAGVNALRAPGGFVLALPAAALRPVVEQLLDGRTTDDRPLLGAALVPERAARRIRQAAGLPDRDGLLVGAVADDSPAQRAGLRRGDLISSVDGQPVDEPEALVDALRRAAGADGRLRLGVERVTERLELDVSLSGEASS
jgi:serine protease Do